ncbi:uncharacterized protein LOC120278582 [Dioscorea cayenensis subsp. rotundata]|uniref:Uncharacterized protein LOC120278582 n=1 Tax=Dioscorea cayennensis subsp. rotundata TaxID=55577 RepID=A0AB40CMN9_DIOCR|nr:uncharacterized protein LOC120278582 [Dioscorea cayenensis subsp. rotundata]
MFSPNDKNRGIPNLGDLASAQNFLNELNLVDPPLHGRSFTWTNGQTDPIWTRLDRFLLSLDWFSAYPSSIQSALPRFGSDHAPVYLEFGPHTQRSRIFRLEKSWYNNDQLCSLIHDWWTETNQEGCGAFVVSKKLIHLKHYLKVWASENFGFIYVQKNDLLLEINSLDSISKSRDLSDLEVLRVTQLRQDLSSILREEETYWRQRSRITWLKVGNSNTKYFHSIANGRCNKNFIPRISVDGSWIEGNQNLGKLFSDHLGFLIGIARPSRFLWDWQHLFNSRDVVDLSNLDQPFSLDELK